MEFAAPTITASAGGRPRVPVLFGQYEVGRTSKPWVRNQPSPWSLDELPKAVPLPPQGDPGAYDPFAFGFMSDEARVHGKNQHRPPFDSSQVREFVFRTFLGGESGSLTYDAGLAQKKLYPTVDANVSVFRSKSLQRPSSKSIVPGPNHYKLNMDSVESHIANSAARMRSHNARFGHYHPGMQGQKSATDVGVGPASYNTEYEKSLTNDARRTLEKTSKIRPGFGSTTPQRRAAMFGTTTPGPGSYERLEPRMKDLKRANVPGHARV
ncbi:hypothetical protein Ctob_007406 [Chrysochromulina tobinii]|uniref:Uncharacterized protein n=1 Tax=Chrysochromulina tobinii TaxID=1460289 RepID=A0A0M0JYX1_9EUKA|nr:hypothetical protein Ctob_007406 [Chrysochromulina tobinii]|eukprot:KOO31769.1 hypothetical protein Ctob_007406 [Chrysochromulina sp. CCMP291]